MAVLAQIRRGAALAACIAAVGLGGLASAPAAVAAPTAAPSVGALSAAPEAVANKCLAADYCIYAGHSICRFRQLTVGTTASGCVLIRQGQISVRVVNLTNRIIAYYARDNFRTRLGAIAPHSSAAVTCGCQVRSFRPVA